MSLNLDKILSSSGPIISKYADFKSANINESIKSYMPLSKFMRPINTKTKEDVDILSFLRNDNFTFVFGLNFNRSTPDTEPLPKTKDLSSFKTLFLTRKLYCDLLSIIF